MQKHHLLRFYIRFGFEQSPLQCPNGAQASTFLQATPITVKTRGVRKEEQA